MPSKPSPAKKTLACLCLSLCVLATASYASGLLKDLYTNPLEPALEGRMSLVAELSGDTCNTEIRFIIDNDSLGGKNIGCDKKDAESKEINPSKEGYGCGTHQAKAEVYSDGVLQDNMSREIIIGNKPDIIMNQNPVQGSDEAILFKDPVTGDGVQNIKVRIYNILEGKSSARQDRTDANGSIIFRPEYTGDYMLLIDEPDYCGVVTFTVKKEYNIAGPYPPNPRSGEHVKIVLPPGVSLRVVDGSGSTYLVGNTSIEGNVNFTIDAPGNYTIAIGEESRIYVSKNVTILISEKPGSSLSIDPPKALRGGAVLIRAFSGNEPIKNSLIVLSSNAKGREEFATDAEGKIIYIPTATGTYTVSFSDPAYQGSNASFDVGGLLHPDYAPQEPRTDGDITVEVLDESNKPADGVSVSEGANVLGITGTDGKLSFRLTDPGKHALSFTKQDHMNASLELNVSSPLSIELSSYDIELDQSISIKSLDPRNREVAAEYLITKPDGKQVTTHSPYTPDAAGAYGIRSQKEAYIGAETSFTVRPRPIDMTVNLAGEDLLINVSSRGVPVSGLHILVESGAGTIDTVTNSKGKTTAQVKGTGELIITANPGNIDPDYGTSVKNQKIVKQREITSLLAIFAVIALLALAAAVLVYLIPRKEKRSVNVREGYQAPEAVSRRGPYFDSGGSKSGLRSSPILEKKRAEYSHARKKDKKPPEPYFSRREDSSLSRK